MHRIGIIIIVSLLAACAYSPQQVTIKPTVDLDGERYGMGRSIKVSAEDQRKDKVIGSRGGLYKETSLITISNDINSAVVRAAEAKLATQGFNVNATEDQTPAQVKIIIEKLSYEVPEGQTIGKKLVLKSILRVEASSQGNTYNGRYETSSKRQSVVTPNNANNEKMINTVLSSTLTRLFADTKLKAFLSNI